VRSSEKLTMLITLLKAGFAVCYVEVSVSRMESFSGT